MSLRVAEFDTFDTRTDSGSQTSVACAECDLLIAEMSILEGKINDPHYSLDVAACSTGQLLHSQLMA